jgi:hypothetical protein
MPSSEKSVAARYIKHCSSGFGDEKSLRAILPFLPPALELLTIFATLLVAEAAFHSCYNWNGYGSPTKVVGYGSAGGVTLLMICVLVMLIYKRLFMREKATT